MKRSIAVLWKGVLDRDPECWSELVSRFEPLVYAVARKVGLSDSESDDCAQETWLSLFRTRHKIKTPNKIPGWLVRTASRRSTRIARGREKDIIIEESPEVMDRECLPDEELERLETATLVHLAIESLEPRCRQLLHALYLSPKEKKYREIARDLGIPANSFGPIRSRCLRKLKSILHELGYDEVLNDHGGGS
jgi:RNA polymerase sigma factor (sigma-70 family)